MATVPYPRLVTYPRCMTSTLMAMVTNPRCMTSILMAMVTYPRLLTYPRCMTSTLMAMVTYPRLITYPKCMTSTLMAIVTCTTSIIGCTIISYKLQEYCRIESDKCRIIFKPVLVWSTTNQSYNHTSYLLLQIKHMEI